MGWLHRIFWGKLIAYFFSGRGPPEGNIPPGASYQDLLVTPPFHRAPKRVMVRLGLNDEELTGWIIADLLIMSSGFLGIFGEGLSF